MVLLRLPRFRRLCDLARKDEGSATVEAILWLPIFFLIIGLATDVTMIFHANSRALRVVEDVNRAISVGRITSLTEAQADIVKMLPNYAHVTAVVKVSNGVITSKVTIPVSSVVVIGAVKSLIGQSIYVTTSQYVEM